MYLKPRQFFSTLRLAVDHFSGQPVNLCLETMTELIELITGYYMDDSENSGTPKSSILIGFSIINHPFWGIPIFGNTHILLQLQLMVQKSDDHQLRVCSLSHYIQVLFFVNPRWV